MLNYLLLNLFSCYLVQFTSFGAYIKFCFFLAVLGIHGMLTQKQSETADTDKTWESLKGSGLRKYKGGMSLKTLAPFCKISI